MSYIFSDTCFPRVSKFVLEYRQAFVEARLDQIPRNQFVPGQYVQVGNPVREDEEYLFLVTDIDQENDFIYLDWGGIITTTLKR